MVERLVSSQEMRDLLKDLWFESLRPAPFKYNDLVLI